jgi:hypothetical protein
MSTIDACMEPNPVPRGRATGCLPRVSRPGEWFPLYSERLDVLTDAEIEEIGPLVNNQQFVEEVLDQNGHGSCATESTGQDTMVIRAFSGQPFVLLSPLFIYNTTSHGRDAGSSIDENLRFVREKGIAPESLYPRSGGFRRKPSEEAIAEALKYRVEEFYDITTVRELLSSLALGYPVVYGARGHSVLKLQYLGNGRTLDVNSWGTNWKNGGFGEWASPSNVNWRYGAWAARTVVEAA